MYFHQLLRDQLEKFFPSGIPAQESFQDFLCAVHDSYVRFDNAQQAAPADSVSGHAGIIKQLKDAISNFGDSEDISLAGNNDLGSIIAYLEQQMLEKKKSEILLKQSEKRMRLALQTIEDNVWEYDFRSRKMIFAQTETSILKLNRTEYVDEENTEWWKSIYEEDIELATDIFRKYNKGEISKHSIEYRMYCRDGSLKWVLNRGGVIQRDSTGKTVKVIGSLTDIDKLKNVQNELAATANRLSNLLTNMQTAVLARDENGRVVLMNKKFCEFFSIAAEPESFASADYPETVEEFSRRFKYPEAFVARIHTLLRERELVIDEELEMADGRVLLRSYIPLFSGHEYKGHLWKYDDVTGKRKAEEQLLQSETRLRMALEKIGDNVWEHNFITGETYFSNTRNQLLGYDTGEYISNAALWWDRIHPEDRQVLEENDKLYTNGLIDHHSLEYKLVDKSGLVKWVLDRGVVIEKDSKGKPLKIIGTHTDITQRKLAEQAIARSEEKYRSIIANMNLGLLEVDMQENIHYANQSFCDMSGYTAEELLDKKASTLFFRGENTELLEAKNDLRRKGLSDAYEIAVKNKRGQLKWWLISGAPRYNDKGELVGTVGIHLDITEQKKLELELVMAREAAEESARAKEVFLANMSHEIRTPMNAILGMSRQLASTPLNDKQQFYLQTINTAGEHLLVVINDILDISKIEAGKLQLEKIGFRLREALKHCIRVMMHRAEEKGLHLSIDMDENISEVLIGDPYRLNQVLLNLLSNSIKFTEKGSVRVSCRLESEKNYRQWVSIGVDDTGMGMDENFMASLFQKFVQEDRTTARRFGGTGLGMSISKQLIELMDGTINVSSRKNEGTSITMLVPFFKGTEEDIPQKVRENADSSLLLNKKILLVEDNEMNRLVAIAVLKKYGALIKEAVNGKEAIDELRQSSYDIILMDIQMPVMDGLEATRIIREEVTGEIPIIALTANAIKGENERCLQAGMNDYVSKPFKEEDLVSAIAHWLGKRTTMQQLETVMSTENVKLFDLSKLSKLSGGNKEFISRMTTLFAEQTPLSVREIREAWQKKDFNTMRSVAHRIRPGIDNMGIGVLYQDIRDIEILAANEPGSSRFEELVTRLEDIIGKVVLQLKEAS